jgi:uncharacterized protein (DUF427 family)
MDSGYVERPDYRVDLLPRRNAFSARAGEVVLAESQRCIVVDEQDHGLVVYFPRDDVRLGELEPSDHSTHCPYKGDASHWTPRGGTDVVAWSYEDPYPQVARLQGYVAFYQDRVTVSIGLAVPAVSGR